MLTSTSSRLASQPAPGAAGSSSSRRVATRCQAAGLGSPPLQPGRQRVREQSPSKSRAAAAAAAAPAVAAPPRLLDAAVAAGSKAAAPLPPLQPPQAGNVVPLTLPKEERLQQELAQLERHYSLPAVPDLDAEYWRQQQQQEQQQQQQQPQQQSQQEQEDAEAIAALLERQRLAAEASTSGRSGAAPLQQPPRGGEVVGSTRSSRGRPAGVPAARRHHASLPDTASVVTCWLHDCATRHARGRTAAAAAAPAAEGPHAAAAAAASRRRLVRPGEQPGTPGSDGVSEETRQVRHLLFDYL